jgi:tetratricopeptide (TPR) repeat protein
MNNLVKIVTSPTSQRAELWRLIPVAIAPAVSQEAVQDISRIFQLDASFDTAGTWAGVTDLVETAYLELMGSRRTSVIQQHLYELHHILLNYRDRIDPEYFCLTDTASPAEKTRFYAPDRAHRLVHGLVGMILQWKRTLHDQDRWVVVVRNFDQAQHLATRFFVELARRSAVGFHIDVVIESRYDDLTPRLSGMEVVAAAQWIADLRPDPRRPPNPTQAEVEACVKYSSDVVLEQEYPMLLAHYRSIGNDLQAARVALKVFIIYNSYGYYHEARKLMDIILPYFDQIVGADEVERIYYVSKMNICLVMTDDPDGGLRVIGDLAASYLTKPHLVANMHYILGMHYLRYAEDKDIQRAEYHILLAVDHIRAARDTPDLPEYPFKKVFIDNGLAFLRARQGRHQEALDLCQSGYEFLTKEMGEDRHLLHRSVLQYNIAQVYVMIGRLDEGLEYYRNAIRMDPNYSEYHNEIGNILQEQERFQEAIEYYLQAIQRSAPYAEVYFNKAVCHLRLGELEDALVCFDWTLELNPAQPESHALRADVLRELERNDEALFGYDTAIALGYDTTAVRVNRAVLHYNNGSFDLALEDMDHVIAHDAQDPSHYENRAAIYQAINREDLYLRDLGLAERVREIA